MLVILEGLILSFWLLLICVVGMAHSRYGGAETLYSDKNKDHKVGWDLHRIPDTGSNDVRNNAVDRIKHTEKLCL